MAEFSVAWRSTKPLVCFADILCLYLIGQRRHESTHVYSKTKYAEQERDPIVNIVVVIPKETSPTLGDVATLNVKLLPRTFSFDNSEGLTFSVRLLYYGNIKN